RLVVELVVGLRDVVEEDVRALAAELQRHGDDVGACVLHDQAAGRGLTGERDLADAVAGGQRLTGLDAEAVDDVQHTGGQQVADQVDPPHDRGGGLLGRLQHDAVPGGKRGGELPYGHEDRE